MKNHDIPKNNINVNEEELHITKPSSALETTQKKRPYEILVTFFYLGKIPYAPGSFGSMAAFPVYFVCFLICMLFFKNMSFNTINLSILLFSVLLFFLGIKTIDAYIKNQENQDPPEIVIDEVLGQLITINLVVILLQYVDKKDIQIILDTKISNVWLLNILFITMFILFRCFDIVKPWPINAIDRHVKGGFGVMLDDVVAAIFATFSFFVLFYFVIDFIK